ncbi:MAG: FeoB-associated Cys-rich membrane protein [Clostridia bacterium]|nr:FeoB-associated Cys-rich membrane protein [Clostridia bacterium]
MKDIIAIATVVIVVGLALLYIIKSKKKGVKCIGCPMAGKCGKQCDGQCTEYK